MKLNKGIFGKDLENAFTSDELLGKDVIDGKGDFIGVVEKVFIDSKTLDFAGISVDKGFLRRSFVIGSGYIRKITKYAVFLKTSIVFQIRSMSVFDRDGKKIGIVKNVILNGSKNSIREVIVRTRLLKTITIPRAYIETLGSNLILNITKNDLNSLA